MTTQPPASKSEESVRLLGKIAEGIDALREEIRYLSSLIEPNANDTARLTETLDRISAALAAPGAAALAAPQAGVGSVWFVADNLVLTYNDDGTPAYRLKGGSYSKFGVRVWPEVLPALGINPTTLKPGPNPVNLHVCAVTNENGQPRKVTGLASHARQLSTPPAAPAAPVAAKEDEDIPF